MSTIVLITAGKQYQQHGNQRLWHLYITRSDLSEAVICDLATLGDTFLQRILGLFRFFPPSGLFPPPPPPPPTVGAQKLNPTPQLQHISQSIKSRSELQLFLSCNLIGCCKKLKLFLSCNLIPNWRLINFYFSSIFGAKTSIDFCKKDLDMPRSSVVDFSSYLCEVCADENLKNSEKIGGEGQIVEVNQSLFTRRKNQVGRVLPSTWVVGGICR